MKKYVFVLLIGILFLTGCGKSFEADLSDAYSVSYEGNDGEGEALVSVDADKFASIVGDWSSQVAKNDDKSLALIYDLSSLLDTVSFTVEPSSALSNGDEIKVTMSYDEEMAKKLKAKLKFEEKTITIPEDTFRIKTMVDSEKLKEDFKVVLDGTYPIVDANITRLSDDEIATNLRYEILNVDLKKKEVKVKFSMSEQTKKALNLELVDEIVDFPVEIKNKYVDEFEIIDKKELDNMKAEAYDKVIAYLEAEKDSSFSSVFDYGDKKSYTEPELYKVYLQNIKPGTSYYDFVNRLIFVYKTYVNSTKVEDVPCYMAVAQNNIIELEDESLVYNLASMKFLKYSVSLNTIDDFETKEINKLMDDYTSVSVTGEELKNLFTK